MNKTKLLFAAIYLFALSLEAQITDPKATEVWKPAPRVITPGTATNTAPSDAIVLFDGKNAMVLVASIMVDAAEKLGTDISIFLFRPFLANQESCEPFKLGLEGEIIICGS